MSKPTEQPSYVAIFKRIATAPDAVQDEVSAQFVGQDADWRVIQGQLMRTHDSVFTCYFEVHPKDYPHSIYCELDLNKNPTLKYTHTGSIYQIRGKISSARKYSITLADASVELLEQAPGPGDSPPVTTFSAIEPPPRAVDVPAPDLLTVSKKSSRRGSRVFGQPSVRTSDRHVSP